MLAPAAVIPLTDSEHAVLPVQFALDPGPQVDWARDENNPNMLTTLQLADQEKLVLLKVDMSVHVWCLHNIVCCDQEYLDVVQVPLPSCFLDPELAAR